MEQKSPLDAKLEELQKEVEPVSEPTPVTDAEPVVEPTPEPEGEVVDEPKGDVDAVKPSEDVYVPNLKFKVHDQEYEFDPLLKDVIKDKNSEEKIRDIYTKAYGLDAAQKSRDSWKQKHEEVEGKVKAYSEIFDLPIKLYKDGKVIEAVRATFKDEDILEAAKHLIRLNQATPEERQKMEHEFTQSKTNYQKEDEYNEIITKAQRAEYEAVQARIDLELSKGEINEIAKFVDTKFGPNAFRSEVNLYGDAQYRAGRKIQPDEAVKAVYEKYKVFYTPNSVSAPTNNTVNKVVEPSKSTSIPNIKSSGSAGRVAKAKTMADLDKIAEELNKE
jgi:hypothetical protein